MNIKNYLKRLFSKHTLSWSDKRYYSSYVLQNFINDEEKVDLLKIFYLNSYRADGQYLNHIKNVFSSKRYCEICRLPKEDSFIEDEFGLIPFGDYIRIFLVEMKEGIYRVIVELFVAPKLPKLNPYTSSVLFHLHNINQAEVQCLTKCREQVYPY